MNINEHRLIFQHRETSEHFASELPQEAEISDELKLRESELQNELKPYTKFTGVPRLFTQSEQKWLKTPLNERDNKFYDSYIRRAVLEKLSSYQVVDNTISAYKEKNSLSLNSYNTWSDKQKTDLKIAIADKLFDVGKNSGKHMSSEMLKNYLAVFQIIKPSIRRESIEDIERGVVTVLSTEKIWNFEEFQNLLKNAAKDFGRSIDLSSIVSGAEFSSVVLTDRKGFSSLRFKILASGPNGMMMFEVSNLPPNPDEFTKVLREFREDNGKVYISVNLSGRRLGEELVQTFLGSDKEHVANIKTFNGRLSLPAEEK